MRRLRSRAIWDETRRPHDNVLDWAIAYGRALLYEIQPIRFRTLQVGITDVVQFIQQLFNVIQVLATKWIPSVTYHVAVFVWNRPLRQWCYVGLAVLYYGFVRWIHDMLDAGPAVIIVTLLAIIFTVGLGDETERNDGRQRVSAYSVFNRGFERLMGSVDADSLLAQYTGGGMMPMNPDGAAGGAGGFDARGRNGNMNPHRIPRRNGGENDNAEADGRNEGNDVDNNNGNNNRARRSGKKARREQKRNQRRQQQQQQSFQDGGIRDGGDENMDNGHGDIDIDIINEDGDMMAMRHLIDNEIQMEGNE